MKEQYIPSSEEVKKAEEMISEKEKKQSIDRQYFEEMLDTIKFQLKEKYPNEKFDFERSKGTKGSYYGEEHAIHIFKYDKHEEEWCPIGYLQLPDRTVGGYRDSKLDFTDVRGIDNPVGDDVIALINKVLDQNKEKE